MEWESAITKVEPNHLVTRGYRQEDLIGNVPFSHVFFLLLKGNLPTSQEGTMIDAILTACIDHGVTPPTAMASRLIASGGVPMPTAIAGGLLSIGDAHGGAIEKGAKLFQEGVKILQETKASIDTVAVQIVADARKKKQRILGFGHRVHTKDPRTTRLFTLAQELGIAGDHVALVRAIETELREKTGRSLPLNVDGAIAAIISDMGFDWRLGKSFFLMGRVAGLTAHVYEEQTTEKPMRKMATVSCSYTGPAERDLPQRYQHKDNMEE